LDQGSLSVGCACKFIKTKKSYCAEEELKKWEKYLILFKKVGKTQIKGDENPKAWTCAYPL